MQQNYQQSNSQNIYGTQSSPQQQGNFYNLSNSMQNMGLNNNSNSQPSTAMSASYAAPTFK